MSVEDLDRATTDELVSRYAEAAHRHGEAIGRGLGDRRTQTLMRSRPSIESFAVATDKGSCSRCLLARMPVSGPGLEHTRWSLLPTKVSLS